jgi:hypothetical protein
VHLLSVMLLPVTLSPSVLNEPVATVRVDVCEKDSACVEFLSKVTWDKKQSGLQDAR